MPLPLLALFFAAFAFGTTEFVIAGVLPQVAAGLGVSIPNAGYLVSGYAIGIAVGGPLFTIATARMPRKTLLLWLLIAFTIGQAACALAPDFFSMLVLRVAIAFAHGVYFGVAMVVAVGLVREDQRGMAVALILAGLTVSSIVGVPLGTAIGNVFGWRATFWAMFVLGIIAIVAMLLLVPRGTGAVSAPAGLRNEVRVLGRQQVWTCLVIMLMLMICQFVPYTYITPLLQEVTGIDAATVPWVLLLNGLGATAGVFIGGKLSERFLMPTLMFLPVLQGADASDHLPRQPLPLADGGRAVRLERRQFCDRHADPDAHPHLDRRRAEPGVLAHPVRLQRRHRNRGLARRNAAQRRFRLSQPAAFRRRGYGGGGNRCHRLLCLGKARRRDAAALRSWQLNRPYNLRRPPG